MLKEINRYFFKLCLFFQKKRNSGFQIAPCFCSHFPSFSEKRKEIRQVRKLIPSRSKCFPKDFFQIDLNQVSSSQNLKSGLSSPRFLISNKPHPEQCASAKPSRFLCSPLCDPEKTTRHLWSANHQLSNEKLDTEADVPKQGARVLRDLLNINYNTTITINNNCGSSSSQALPLLQTLEIEKKVKSENTLEKPLKIPKKRVPRKDYFISITEADENTCPQPLSLKGRAPSKFDQQQQLNKTPGFKNLQNLPALNQQPSTKRRVLSQNRPELQTQKILLSNLTPLNHVLNSKPKDGGLRAELSLAWKNQRSIRRSDLVGVNLRPEMNETKVPLSRRKFLPSIVNNGK